MKLRPFIAWATVGWTVLIGAGTAYAMHNLLTDPEFKVAVTECLVRWGITWAVIAVPGIVVWLRLGKGKVIQLRPFIKWAVVGWTALIWAWMFWGVMWIGYGIYVVAELFSIWFVVALPGIVVWLLVGKGKESQ